LTPARLTGLLLPVQGGLLVQAFPLLFSRRLFAAVIAMLACTHVAAAALDYPNRPVRVIIPFSAGEAPYILMRIVAQALTEKVGAIRRRREPAGRKYYHRHAHLASDGAKDIKYR
jgi:hypothetical protein